MKYAPHKIRDFHLKYPDKPGPPNKLEEWIKAWEDGDDNYDYLDNDFAMTKAEKTAWLKKH